MPSGLALLADDPREAFEPVGQVGRDDQLLAFEHRKVGVQGVRQIHVQHPGGRLPRQEHRAHIGPQPEGGEGDVGVDAHRKGIERAAFGKQRHEPEGGDKVDRRSKTE